VTGNGTSRNRRKPLDVVSSFALPGQTDRDVVLSTMFTWATGSLHILCDLMEEDGPILSDLGGRDLGTDPSEVEIEVAVDLVVAFVIGLADIVSTALEAQRITE
jgi:hypothetical protein